MNRYKLKYIIIASEALLLFALTILFVINYTTIKQSLLNIEKKKIEKIIQSNLPTITTLYKLGFIDDLNDILHSIQQNNPNIKKLFITHKKVPKKLSFPIQNNSSYLVVDFQYTTTQKVLNAYKKQIVGFFILFLFFFFLSISFLNQKLKAIYLLAEKIKNIDLKKIKPLPLFDRYEEIQNITNSINYFIKTLKTNLQRLQMTQKHLKEAQKIAKLSSWEYDPSDDNFYATTQLYRILHIHTSTKLTWKRFLSFFPASQRKKFLQEIENLKTRQDKRSIEITSKLLTPNGEKYLKSIIKKQIRYQKLKFIAISMDVTEEMKAKHQVEFLAYHDALTGFFNRHILKDQLEFIFNLAKREEKEFSLFYIDIDNFKYINDTYGHTVGDQVLLAFAKKLEKLVRRSDLIFRLGGDEFLIIFYDIKDKKALEEIAKKILQDIQKPISIEDKDLQIQCSIGIASYPKHATDPQKLIQYADIAMYEAKKSGKNNYKIFDQSMQKNLLSSHNLLNELKMALQKEDELQLYIQPKIKLATKQISGGEILIRWLHPQKGLIPPNEFIPLAEESNLILKLDEYVLKKSFQKIAQWQKAGVKDLKIAINLSAKQFKNPFFYEMIQSLLKLYPIDTSMIELEVTESASMEEIGRSIEILKKLKKLGFSIAIDDFGTGYSSLNYIKKLPFDSLKIDRSFVQDIHKDKDDRAITELIVKIAKVLQKETIAEGVENKVHEELLKSLSCTYAQGFLYYKPIPLKEFEKLLPIDNHINL